MNTTFPGVQVNLVDRSFGSRTTSRFRCGLIGVANKGPFDTALPVRTLKEVRSAIGTTLPNRFLADAAAMVANVSDGATVVRIGNRYSDISTDSTGTSGTRSLTSVSGAPRFADGDYVRVAQVGKVTTIGARVLGTPAGSAITLNTLNSALADTYTTGTLAKATGANAANAAEAFLISPAYGSGLSLGTVSGSRNGNVLTCTSTPVGVVAPGDIVQIVQTGKATTSEIMVGSIDGFAKTITFQTTDIAQSGYIALVLQDTYTSATVSKLTSYPTTAVVQLYAKDAGTWANSATPAVGLVARVKPGSAAGTKKLVIYHDSGAVETIDNLTWADALASTYWPTAINAVSAYVTAAVASAGSQPPANSREPWDLSTAFMPSSGKVNVSGFSNGDDGLNPSSTDYVGTIDQNTGVRTGLKIFEDTDSLTISIIAAPGAFSVAGDADSSTTRSNWVAVAQEINRIAVARNAYGIVDAPDNLSLRQANDFANGQGDYSSGNISGGINTRNLGFLWNWIQINDFFTGLARWVPPTVGKFRAFINSFDGAKPWYAAAGETRGLIPEAKAVRYPLVTDDQKIAAYRNGNVVNQILLHKGSITVWGNLTMQRTDSKLSDENNMMLVNHVLGGLSDIGRGFVFDPNDPILLSQINAAYTSFLGGVKNERGLEAYELVVDETNNTAATRNARGVVVDLKIIPTSAVEVITINCVVLESGALQGIQVV